LFSERAAYGKDKASLRYLRSVVVGECSIWFDARVVFLRRAAPISGSQLTLVSTSYPFLQLPLGREFPPFLHHNRALPVSRSHTGQRTYIRAPRSYKILRQIQGILNRHAQVRRLCPRTCSAARATPTSSSP